MKSVLIITRDFPPNSPHVGWMIRVAELAKYLSSKDCKVYVLAIKRRKEWHDLIDMDEKVDVFYIKDFFSYWDIPRNQSNLVELGVQAFTHLFRKLFKNKMIDINHFSWNKYVKKASMLIDKENIKNVFISMPPFSLQKVAVALKQKFGEDVNLIVDYRDAWTVGGRFIVDKSDSLVDSLRSFEQSAIRFHDHTLFVSEGMKKMYLDLFDVSSPHIVENGFILRNNTVSCDKEFLEKINKAKQEKRVVLGYFGTGSADGSMYHKDFSNLLKVLENDEELTSKLCIVVQGKVSLPSVFPKGLKVFSFPFVENRQTVARMKKVDVCLHVYSDSVDAPVMMGGKFYDYMASGSPIWFLIPSNAYSLLSVARKNDKIFVSDIFDLEDIKDTLQYIIRLYEEESLHLKGFKKEELKKYSRDFQNSKVYNLLE